MVDNFFLLRNYVKNSKNRPDWKKLSILFSYEVINNNN